MTALEELLLYMHAQGLVTTADIISGLGTYTVALEDIRCELEDAKCGSYVIRCELEDVKCGLYVARCERLAGKVYALDPSVWLLHVHPSLVPLPARLASPCPWPLPSLDSALPSTAPSPTHP